MPETIAESQCVDWTDPEQVRSLRDTLAEMDSDALAIVGGFLVVSEPYDPGIDSWGKGYPAGGGDPLTVAQLRVSVALVLED